MQEPQVIFMDDGQPRFVCPQCGVKYKKVSGLRGHMKECGRGAKCPLCPKVVTQRRNLRKHMERHQREASMGSGALDILVGVGGVAGGVTGCDQGKKDLDVVVAAAADLKASFVKPWKFFSYDDQTIM